MNSKLIRSSDAEILHVLGIPHAVLIEDHESPSRIEILEVIGSPGMGVPLHVHENEVETFYVADGEVASLHVPKNNSIICNGPQILDNFIGRYKV